MEQIMIRSVEGYPNQAIDADPKAAILQERFFEFIFEGKRWMDLRRFGDSYVFANTTMPTYETYRLLWPIDRNTLTNNSALSAKLRVTRFFNSSKIN